MFRKLPNNQSHLEVQNFSTMESFQDQINTLKNSIKIIVNNLKSEIDLLKSDLKDHQNSIASKLEFFFRSNKEAEDTFHQFNSTITKSIKQILLTIDKMKTTEQNIIQQKNAEKLERKGSLGSFGLKSFIHSLQGNYSNTEDYQIKFDKIDYEIVMLKAKLKDICEIEDFQEKIRDLKEKIEAEVRDMIKRQKKIDSKGETEKRFEALQDFITVQRKELFNTNAELDQKISKLQIQLKFITNFLKENLNLPEIIINL